MLLRGSIVALRIIGEHGVVDDDAALAVEPGGLLEAGTAAIVAVGTTGESATLDEAEHCAVIARCVALAAGRIPVIAGTGANATAEAIRLTRCAAEVGADAALLVTPYYNKPTESVRGPLQYQLGTSAFGPATWANLFDLTMPLKYIASVIPDGASLLWMVLYAGFVYSACLPRLRELCGPDFALYSGDDGTGCEFIERALMRGADGRCWSINGRRRVFRLTPRMRRRLALSRWLARSRAGEYAAALAVTLAGYVLAGWDHLRGRR